MDVEVLESWEQTGMHSAFHNSFHLKAECAVFADRLFVVHRPAEV